MGPNKTKVIYSSVIGWAIGGFTIGVAFILLFVPTLVFIDLIYGISDVQYQIIGRINDIPFLLKLMIPTLFMAFGGYIRAAYRINRLNIDQSYTETLPIVNWRLIWACVRISIALNFLFIVFFYNEYACEGLGCLGLLGISTVLAFISGLISVIFALILSGTSKKLYDYKGSRNLFITFLLSATCTWILHFVLILLNS